jgi:hypothetical protein
MRIFNQIIKDDPSTQVVEYKGKLKSYTTEIKTFGQIVLNQCSFNRTDNHTGVKIIITEDQETLNTCIIGTDLMKIIPDFKNIIITLEKTIETMSSDVLQRYNRNVLHLIRISSNEFDQINTIDTVSNNHLENDEYEINSVRYQLEQRLTECAATSLDSIMVKNPTRVKFNIELINSNQQPLCAKARPLPYNLKDKVKQLLKEQEEAGIIRKSEGNWTSPLRVVHKPDGDIRITIDYKPLNRIIKNDNYPLPNISDIYKQLAKTNYFSKIDLKSAYYQIECDEQSKKYTAFVCEFGIFEYNVMPMGIKTAPACFQRFIVETFNEFIDQKVLQIYLDDFIVNTRTIVNFIVNRRTSRRMQ